MEEILRRNPKIVVDDRLQGVVPLLNLNDVGRGAAAVAPQLNRQPPQPQSQPQPNTSFVPARPQGAMR